MSEYDHDGGMAHLEHDGLEHRARKRPPAPGKSTLTSRLGASPASIARAVVAQLQAAESPAPAAVQARGDLDGPDVHALAAQGTAGGGGTLPFLDEIQRAFGHHDVSGVRAHVGGAAAEASAAMGARAYAAGDAVAFAEAPDLHLAAHEAAHVVQQRGGVRLSDGVGRAGDEYERHADAVADAVVRGDSAQALLDGMAHRGAAGGPAVQRDPGPGAQALDELLARTPRPPAADIVSIIRLHPREQRAIVAAVRQRCGAELADEVQRIASILPAQAALAAQPPPDAGPDLRGPGPRPASRAVPQPTVSRGDGGTVDVTASPDDRSSVRARVRPSGANGSAPALRDVRVVVSGEGRDTTGELSATVRPDGGAATSAEGAVRTDGGTVLRGQAEAEIEPGDRGPEAAASAGATVEIPLDDRNTLIAGGVIHSDGRLDLSVGVDLLHRRVRDLPLSEASRRPLLRLFVNVTTPLDGGTPSVSGGAAVQFSRAGGVGQAGDRYERHADAVADAVVRGDSAQSLLDSLLGPAPSAAPAVQKQDRPGSGPAVDPAQDQRRAAAETARRRTLGRLQDQELITLARELDAEVMNPPPSMGPRERAAKAQTLLEIHRILSERMSRPRGGQEMDADALPSQPEPGSVSAEDFDSNSPLAGILEDISPFGNELQWRALAGGEREVRTAPRRRVPRRPDPSPQPNAQPPAQAAPEAALERELGPTDERPNGGRWEGDPTSRSAFASEAQSRLRAGFDATRADARREFPLSATGDDRNTGVIRGLALLNGYVSTIRSMLTLPNVPHNFGDDLRYNLGPQRAPSARGPVDHSADWQRGARAAIAAWNGMSEQQRRAIISGNERHDLIDELEGAVRAEGILRSRGTR